MSSNLFNYIIAFASAIGGFLFGYEIGIIDQVLDMKDFGLRYGIKFLKVVDGVLIPVDTPDAVNLKGNVTFIFLAGCAAGAVVVSFMADSLGRKKSILVGASLFAGGGLIQCLCDSLSVFYVGRVVSGLGIGILSMVVPLYISETAPTAIRGRMIAVQQLMITIGILFAALINTLIRMSEKGNEREWRLSLGMQVIPGLILMVIMLFMPASPRWLEDRNRHQEAVATLARIRAQSPNSQSVIEEYREIKQGVDHERKIGHASWKELARPGLMNRVLICIVLQVFQQWTGINVILYYASELFTKMGFSYQDASTKLNIINAVINVVFTLPGMYLVERMGRRRLLILGGFGYLSINNSMGISHLLVCLFLGLSKTTPSFAWGAVIFVYLFIIFFSGTWGPVVWVYQSEVFPLRIRAKGTGIATFFNWTMNAVIAKISPILLKEIDFYLYLIFGCTGILMALFTIFFVPETMGKSLEEMDMLFGFAGGDDVENVLVEGEKIKN